MFDGDHTQGRIAGQDAARRAPRPFRCPNRQDTHDREAPPGQEKGLFANRRQGQIRIRVAELDWIEVLWVANGWSLREEWTWQAWALSTCTGITSIRLWTGAPNT